MDGYLNLAQKYTFSPKKPSNYPQHFFKKTCLFTKAIKNKRNLANFTV